MAAYNAQSKLLLVGILTVDANDSLKFSKSIACVESITSVVILFDYLAILETLGNLVVFCTDDRNVKK